MAKWRDIVWWLGYVIMAICLQALMPGLDVLAVGLIILLQEEDYRSMLWLLPLFCILQEGIGTRPFGAIIVWYAAIIMVYIGARWMFEARNFIFVFLLSTCLGAVYLGVAWLMAPLQNQVFNFAESLDKSLVQAIFMPFAWWVFTSLRPAKAAEAENE